MIITKFRGISGNCWSAFSSILRAMSTLIGIDIGFRSHIVVKATPPPEGSVEPQVDVVLNQKKESENR